MVRKPDSDSRWHNGYWRDSHTILEFVVWPNITYKTSLWCEDCLHLYKHMFKSYFNRPKIIQEQTTFLPLFKFFTVLFVKMQRQSETMVKYNEWSKG